MNVQGSCALFYLDRPVQNLIIKKLSLIELYNLSVVSKAFLLLKKNYIESYFLETFKITQNFYNPKLKDFTFGILLKNVHELSNASKITMINAIRNPYLKFCQFQELSKTYSPALELAEKSILEIKTTGQRSKAYFNLLQTTGQTKYLSLLTTELQKAWKGTTDIFLNILYDYIQGVEILSNKNPEIGKEYEILINPILKELTKEHPEFSHEIVLLYLRKIDISSNPNKDISRAEKIAKGMIIETHQFIALFYILLISKKMGITNNYSSLKKKIKKIPFISHYTLKDAVQRALPVCVKTARWLASLNGNTIFKLSSLLDIVVFTKELKDLDSFIKCEKNRHCGFLIIQATQIALRIFNSIELAKCIASQILKFNEINQNYDYFKAFLEIAKFSKNKDDRNYAFEISFKMANIIYKIKSLKKLMDVYESPFLSDKVNEIVNTNEENCLIYLETAVLTHDIYYLNEAIKMKGQLDEVSQSNFLLKICKVSIKYFHNMLLARKACQGITNILCKKAAISYIAEVSEDTDDFLLAKEFFSKSNLEELFKKILRRLVLQKKFELAAQFDHCYKAT